MKLFHLPWPLASVGYTIAIIFGLAHAPLRGETSEISWIPHNEVALLPASASEEQLRFLPIFSFTEGTCFPAPAIDGEGRLGAGLKASGKMNGDCLAFDQANIYVQSLSLGPYRVHAYALYFPKDGSNPNSVGGHRHDWEHVLVWTENDQVQQVTFRQHSGWYTMPLRHVKHSGSRVLVYVAKAKHGLYHSRNNGPGGLLEGLCYFCDTRSDPGLLWDAPHRLLAFETMTPFQQYVLRQSIWGSANSPFRDDVFPASAKAILEGETCRGRGCQCNSEEGSCPGFP